MVRHEDPAAPALDDVGRVLLEAITRALQAFASGDEGGALRDGFLALARGLATQRSFLARVDAHRRITEVLACEGLSAEQVDALRSGTSSPGVSPTLIRRALTTGRVQVVEDARLASRRGEVTDSLATGDYSVVCAGVADPVSRLPLAVLYLQTSSLTEPLTRAQGRYVEAYAQALGHAWAVWERAETERAVAGAERHAGPGEILGESEAVRALRDHVRRVLLPAMAVERPDPILILGETGTGKEVLARYLHAHSARAHGRFVAVNCGGLSGDTLESTLFGHVRGAYTGAVTSSEGLVAAADHGVLFLDELGDMPPQGQLLLLRVLDTRSVRALGARDERAVNCQFVGATNKDLEAEVEAGHFRGDLYHRVRGLSVELVPLRERGDDVRLLLTHYLKHHERRLDKRTAGLSRPVSKLLLRHAWPGNVRELASVCSALVAHARPGQLIDEDVLVRAAPKVHAALMQAAPRRRPSPLGTVGLHGTLAEVLAQCERAYLGQVGREEGWNKTSMAGRLGLSRSALYARLERHGMKEDNEDDERDDGADPS